VTKSCEVCGASFRVVPAKASARYCGMKCMGLAKRRGAEKACKRCGRLFWCPPSQLLWRTYCSRSCNRLDHPDLPQLARKRVSTQCVRCGRSFEVIPSQTWIAYCGETCRLDARREAGLRYGATLHKPPERLWALCDTSGGPNACWPCGKGSSAYPYATLAVAGKEVLAHRVAWELTYGPIPPKRYVLHNCPGRHNSRCCNPAHLKLGTYKDNAADLERQYREGHLLRPLRRRDAAGRFLEQPHPLFQFFEKIYGPLGRRKEHAH